HIIENADAASQHGLRQRPPSEAQAWREIIPVRSNQAAGSFRSGIHQALARQEGEGGVGEQQAASAGAIVGIENRELIELLEIGSRIFVAGAQVQRETGGDLPIVLEVERVELRVVMSDAVADGRS